MIHSRVGFTNSVWQKLTTAGFNSIPIGEGFIKFVNAVGRRYTSHAAAVVAGEKVITANAASVYDRVYDDTDRAFLLAMENEAPVDSSCRTEFRKWMTCLADGPTGALRNLILRDMAQRFLLLQMSEEDRIDRGEIPQRPLLARDGHPFVGRFRNQVSITENPRVRVYPLACLPSLVAFLPRGMERLGRPLPHSEN